MLRYSRSNLDISISISLCFLNVEEKHGSNVGVQRAAVAAAAAAAATAAVAPIAAAAATDSLQAEEPVAVDDRRFHPRQRQNKVIVEVHGPFLAVFAGCI